MYSRYYAGLLPPYVQLKGEEKASPFIKLKGLADSFANCQNTPPNAGDFQTVDSPRLTQITNCLIEWSQNEMELTNQISLRNIHFLIDLIDLFVKAKSSVNNETLKDQKFNDALLKIINKFFTLRFRPFEKHLKVLLVLSYDRLIRWNIEQKNNTEYFLEKRRKIFLLI